MFTVSHTPPPLLFPVFAFVYPVPCCRLFFATIPGLCVERHSSVSETSFHIFIVMASRRLEADRFFTKDFTPEVCSAAVDPHSYGTFRPFTLDSSSLPPPPTDTQASKLPYASSK